ncbi:MAG: diaminopropionate ammonia-lyase [Oscillospiraceae bacterium]|nr:diaminopropionate ammonia-lyase [Oscillospiraceae bacterium]
MSIFKYAVNPHEGEPCPTLSLTSPAQGKKAARFHSGMEGYKPTPLVSLDALASQLGLGKLWIKDESHRFGLNAFKALGGSYAMAKYLCRRLDIPLDEKAFDILRSQDTLAKLGQITFVTATDGNHGRGVAWSARLLGHKAVVYMPAGTAAERLENIRAQGAQADIMDFNYDDCVRLASRMADEQGWVLVQDTAWEGYEDIPTGIMQGYCTMAGEAAEQMAPLSPTHLFLQAGVGSMAGAVAGYFAARFEDAPPVTVVVEPDRADCHYRTALADDGKLHFVTGDMNSMMAGLCCGEPCTISWEILKCRARAFVSCGDEYSARGMRLLGRPLAGDEKIISGESGAVTAGVIHGIMTEPALAELKATLGLDESSRVLLISTEGDTDRENYRKILAGD